MSSLFDAHRRAVALALVAGSVAFAGSVRAARADEIAGFVLDVSGIWRLNGDATRKVAGGDKLPAGGKLAPESAGARTFIVVCHYTGGAKTYTSAAELPGQVDVPLRTRFWKALVGHYRGGVVHAISRGDGLADGVVQLADGRIEPAGLLKNLTPGAYLLQWSPATTDPQAKPATTRMDVRWDPDQPQAVDAAGLKPGLYRVQRADKRTGQPTGAEALVLLAAPDDFASRRKAFDEAVALTESWDESARTKAGGRFLAACLEALSAEEP